MDGYLFDASALSAYLNEQHPYNGKATAIIDAIPLDALRFVSVVTIGEIQYGIRRAEGEHAARLDEYRERLSTIRKHPLLDVTRHTADVYAELKSKLAAKVLRKAGKKLPRWIEDWVSTGSGKRLQIDENDLWIAAQAKERDLVLVTGDADLRNLQAVDPELRLLLTRD